MRTLATLLVIFLFGAVAPGQTFAERFAKIKQIKVLESTRDDVRKILADYITSEDNEYEQDYESEDLDVTVHYANGTCGASESDDGYSSVWNAPDWTVVRVEIETDLESVSTRDIGIDLSKLVKEQRYTSSPNHSIYHDKARGFAIETDENTVEKIIFYPADSKKGRLCTESASAKDFYSRKSWFSKPLEKRFICDWENSPANVEDVILSATEVAATTGRSIGVSIVVVDAENDVVTYSYVISGGVIRGYGAKVVWDLSNAKPGEYTITVGVDDGAGIVGKTVTKTVIVR